jgi:hypothetical protein
MTHDGLGRRRLPRFPTTSCFTNSFDDVTDGAR